NILPLIHESSYDRIENKYGKIENNSDLGFEKKIEGELGIELEKDTEDEPDTECEKDTEDGPGIEFEEDIDIVSESEPGTERKKDTEDGPGIEFEEDIDVVSESDNASENTANYQCGHLPPICIEIYCEKAFGTWEECQEILEHYTHQNNFAIKKKRVDNSLDPHQYTWNCERSGKYISRKTAPPKKQRNKGSKRIGCPFLVNACKSKGPDNETIIKLTSMKLEHNHMLVSENANFATSYRKLTTEMKELIENYVLCDIDVPSQVQLLCVLFPEATIVDYDVKNYVYKFRRTHDIQGCDTAKLFQHFEKERTKNPDWNVQSLIDPETNRLQGVFYMTPEQRELWRRYADIILNNNTAATNAILPNETSESYRWVLQQTIEATRVQPSAFMIDADPGLESVVPEIYPDPTYSIVSGTLGTVNKRTQLHILFNQIESHVAEEQFASRFVAWREKTTSYITLSVPRQLFPEIYNILQKYVTAKILQLHIDQMNEAVMYHSKKVNFEDPYNLTLEVVDNGPIEFEYNFRQIRFDKLREGSNHSLVAEGWEVQSIEHKSNIGQNSEKAYFHISLILRRWYKDEFMDVVVVDEPFLRRNSLEMNSLTPSLPSFPDVADSWNIMLIEAPVQAAAKAIGHKQSIKGTLLGLARKYVEVVNYDDLNDSKILMETFKEWIRIHEEAQCSKQIIEQELDDNQINPLKYIGKGRPSKRCIKSAIKKPKKHTRTSSRASRQCSVCKSKEHDK
ncbi:8051_t:CDS:2, partial [Racocetra fulgida]